MRLIGAAAQNYLHSTCLTAPSYSEEVLPSKPCRNCGLPTRVSSVNVLFFNISCCSELPLTARRTCQSLPLISLSWAVWVCILFVAGICISKAMLILVRFFFFLAHFTSHCCCEEQEISFRSIYLVTETGNYGVFCCVFFFTSESKVSVVLPSDLTWINSPPRLKITYLQVCSDF